MDFKKIITIAMEEYLEELKRTLDGLTPEERRFQPTPKSNHIDYIVWHTSRVEDDFIHRPQGLDPIWKTEGWHRRLGLPETGNGSGYTPDQVRDLPRYDMAEMVRYYDSVRGETFRYVNDLTAEGLDVNPRPDRPGWSIGNMLGFLIVEESQHVGQVAYIRGLQRGLNR